MAKVTLPSFMQSISGRMGKNICFRTTKAGKTSIYIIKNKESNKPPTQSEIKARQLFKKRAAMVKEIMKQNPSISHKEAWKIAMKNYEKSN